jgi:formate dehydrogenase subunit delta
MDTDNLIRMANRIGEFFQAMPDRVEALEGIAQHLQKFWEPRMRLGLLAHCDAAGTSALLPIVRDAIAAHRHRLA